MCPSRRRMKRRPLPPQFMGCHSSAPRTTISPSHRPGSRAHPGAFPSRDWRQGKRAMPSSFHALHDDPRKATFLRAIVLPLVLATSGCTPDILLLPVYAVVGVTKALEDASQSRMYREAMCEGKLPPVVPASPVGSLSEYGQFESGSVSVLDDFVVLDFGRPIQSTTVVASLVVNTKQNGSVGSYRIRAFVDCDAGTISLVSKTECSGDNLSGICKACVPVDPRWSLLVKAGDTPEVFRKSATYVCEKTKQGTIGTSAPQ